MRKWSVYLVIIAALVTIAFGQPGPARAVYTNLTHFVNQTNWRIFYSDGSGDVTELALGTDGQVLTSTGAATAPAFENATGSVEDDVYGDGWNADGTNAPSQNSVYDILHQYDTDDDGDQIPDNW